MSHRPFLAPCLFVLLASCRAAGPESPSSSEVAVSAVSGAVSNTAGSSVAAITPAKPKSKLARVLDAVSPIGTAWAADWKCSGGTLSPAFAGPGTYAFTPVSCSVTWDDDRTVSSTWSGPFTLDYGAGCDTQHPLVDAQAAGCTITRTTGAGGVSRDITGPRGNDYAIRHDTEGAGTGWDSSVSPAPANDGVVASCGASGCAAGRNIVINGSHLTGTVDGVKLWDHTVSTGAGGLDVAGVGSSRVVSGTVVVEHNLARFTATVTFNSVGYGQPACCFPTSGSVSATFSKGPDAGKTESLSFSDVCGEATLTKANGATESLTLAHCL
jgi:hypothetical protein